jgi:hypothetical protein
MEPTLKITGYLQSSAGIPQQSGYIWVKYRWTMTKAEIQAFTKRIDAKIARGEISARPLSDEDKRRAELLRRKREDESRAGRLARAS